MKPRAMLLVAVTMLAAAVGCTWPWETPTTGPTQTTTVIVGAPTPSPSGQPSPAPGCAAVASVSVTKQGGGDLLRVGQAVQLDATPRDADGEALEQQCHGSTFAWEAAGTASCQITGNTASANPTIACSTPGDVTVSVEVSSPGGLGRARFRVQ